MNYSITADLAILRNRSNTGSRTGSGIENVPAGYMDRIYAPDSGGNMRVSQGGADCYLQRYDADGTLAWTITFGGTGDDQIDDVVALAPDDLVLVGRFQGDVDFGTPTLRQLRSAKGGTDIFVRHLTVQ